MELMSKVNLVDTIFYKGGITKGGVKSCSISLNHYCELVHYVQGAYDLTWQVAIKMSHFEVLHGFGSGSKKSAHVLL